MSDETNPVTDLLDASRILARVAGTLATDFPTNREAITAAAAALTAATYAFSEVARLGTMATKK